MSYIDYVSLDWDNITRSEVREKCAKIYRLGIVKTISVRLSATKGYHVKVYLTTVVSELQALRLRRLWNDDGNRVVLDILRDTQPRMVLWNSKCIGNVPFEASEWVNWCEL